MADTPTQRTQLTMAERAFVREFVKDMNPALACVRMGHDELIAMDVAYEYLGKEYIRDAMAEALLAHKEQQRWNDFSARDLGITDAYIMMRLKSIADRAEKPGEQLKALELLGKTIGVFKDTTKVEVTQPKASAFSPEERKRMIETYRSRAK